MDVNETSPYFLKGHPELPLRRKNAHAIREFYVRNCKERAESEIIRALIKATPDFIVLSPKNPAEFGVGLFGRDPRNGMAIMRWVDDNYHVIWREGPEYGSHPQMRA